MQARRLPEAAVRRILLDIDGTLYDFLKVARREMGRLGYERDPSGGWGLTAQGREADLEVVRAVHSDENILGAEPYDGAVEGVAELAEAFRAEVDVVSHRASSTEAATRAWLGRIGLGYRELHCTGEDKSAFYGGCVLAVDDKPSTIADCVRRDVPVATILHGYNLEAVRALNGAVAFGAGWPDMVSDAKALFL